MKPLGKILIVEDEPASADALRYLCEDYGHTVEVANGSDEAFEIAERLEPELLLTDILLCEKRTGIDVAAALAEQDESLAVVVMTSLPPAAVPRYLGEQPVFAVLHKPLQPSEFEQTIAAALTSRTAGC